MPIPVTTPATSTKSFWAWATTLADVRPARPLGPFRTDAAIYATLLLELDGYRLLTDPMLASYASPVQGLLLKRFFAPPLPLSGLLRWMRCSSRTIITTTSIRSLSVT